MDVTIRRRPLGHKQYIHLLKARRIIDLLFRLFEKSILKLWISCNCCIDLSYIFAIVVFLKTPSVV
jgi:hypothetical protein